MSEPHELSYAHPPPPKRRLHVVTRTLIGILAFVFLMPTINIIAGWDNNDRPISKAIGIVVTLTIAFTLGYISLKGRFPFRREKKN